MKKSINDFPIVFSNLAWLGSQVFFFMLKGYNFVGYLVIVYVPYKAKAFCKIVNLNFFYFVASLLYQGSKNYLNYGGARGNQSVSEALLL